MEQLLEKTENYFGKIIKNAEFTGDALELTFDDGIKISIADYGQNCCEERYMVCDDDPSTLIGNKLIAITIKDSATNSTGDYCYHEIEFLEIQTNWNSIQFSTHNKHNGYYGGFILEIKEIK